MMAYVLLSPCGSSHILVEGMQGEGELGVRVVGGEGDTVEDVGEKYSERRWGI